MANELLDRFESIRIFERDGRRAPHKPLLLLFALSRLKNENTERISFNNTEEIVNPLIATYGPFDTDANVAFPFARLANDNCAIWWVEGCERTTGGDLKLRDARARDIKAGFSDDVLEAFKLSPELIDLIAVNLLERHFPPGIHSDIMEAIGFHLGQNVAANGELEEVIRRRRDPSFRSKVLRAYYEQCAICKYDAKMNGAAIALEAAHIKMHAVGGPDQINNGLALCVIHHKLFDLGALTLDRDLNIHVSERVMGSWGRNLYDGYHQKPIARPRDEKMLPEHQYIQWHNLQIFKGEVP